MTVYEVDFSPCVDSSAMLCSCPENVNLFGRPGPGGAVQLSTLSFGGNFVRVKHQQSVKVAD